MLVRSVMLSAAAAFILAATPTLACKGDKKLFNDDFQAVDETWNSDGSYVTVEDGKVKVKAGANLGYAFLYPTTDFSIFDYCLSVRMPNNVDASINDSSGGVLFWAADASNYYFYSLYSDGRVGLFRKNKDKWTTVLNGRKVEGVNIGPGKKNRLRVTAEASSITLYVNDTKVSTLKAPQPEGASQIGIRSESEKAKPDAWKFFDLAVTDVAK